MSWPEHKLGDYFEITSSKRVFQSEWRDAGVPFYRAREVVKLANEGYVENQLFISREMYHEYKEKYGIPLPGDLLITGVGTLGRVYIVKKGDEFYFKDGNIIWLKKKKEIDSRYLDYVFKTDKVQRFIQNSPGATVGTYTISKAKETIIPVPPLEEQKRIAAILDKADALRRKRQQAIDLTYQLLRSVFLDMFGDPVTNPKGFKVGKIEDLLSSVNYGTSAKAGEEGKYPILRMNNITYEGNWNLESLKYLDISEKGRKKYTAEFGDILFNRTNSKELVGKTAVFREKEPFIFAGYLESTQKQ